MLARFDLLALSRRRSAKFVLASLMTIVVTTVFAAFTDLGLSARTLFTKAEAPSQSAILPPQGKPTPQRVETELITITPRGFEPAEIKRPRGRVFLLVNNRASLDEVTLRLDRVAGGRLHEVRVPKKRLDWAELFDLTPGQYVLTEASRPAWISRITVTPQ